MATRGVGGGFAGIAMVLLQPLICTSFARRWPHVQKSDPVHPTES